MLYTYRIKKIHKIYDGDTITAELDLGFKISFIEKIRLSFIDAPEIRGEEREEGLKSRLWLVEHLNSAISKGDDVFVRTNKDSQGKYGRYLGDIIINGESLNLKMVEEGYAELYKK